MLEYRRKGKHITPDERIKIECLHKQGYTQAAIAREIGVSQQAISKELKRGCTTQLNGGIWEYYVIYTADAAQRHADYWKTAHGKGLKIGNNHAYLKDISREIKNGCSPYAAINKVRKSGKYNIKLSKATLYRYIKEGLVPGITYKQLPIGERKRRKGKIKVLRTNHPLHRSIEQRSPSVLLRDEVGHWELDSIIGKSSGKGESLLVATERKTRMEIVIKPTDKNACATVAAIRQIKRMLGKDYNNIVKTITCDNGSEFADQRGIDSTGVTTYYCHPSAPHERGSNENANRLLRRVFPKGQSLKKVTQRQARGAQHFVNHYPRETFNGKTSAELFEGELSKLNLHNPEKVKHFFAL